MPRPYDGNEPHFIPRQVGRDGPAVVLPGDFVHSYSPYDLDEICEGGIDLRAVGRLMMGLLITHFSDEDNIRYPNVRPYLWHEQPEHSRVRIALNTRWDPANAGQTPTLIVKRGQLQSQAQVLNDFQSRTRKPEKQPVRRYTRMTELQYAVGIYSQADGLQESLTDEVFSALTSQFTFLRRKWPFHGMEVVGVSGVLPAEDRGDHWLKTDIVCSFTYEYKWFECDTWREAQDYCIRVAAGQPSYGT